MILETITVSNEMARTTVPLKNGGLNLCPFGKVRNHGANSITVSVFGEGTQKQASQNCGIQLSVIFCVFNRLFAVNGGFRVPPSSMLPVHILLSANRKDSKLSGNSSLVI